MNGLRDDCNGGIVGLMRVMTDRARRCRVAQTRSEALLWDALRGRRLEGSKWRRQQKMGRFVVDFYCSEYKLVVEIDGSAHRDRMERDAERQRALECSGARFARFTASEVEEDLPSVLERLRTLLASPSPLVGEGASD